MPRSGWYVARCVPAPTPTLTVEQAADRARACFVPDGGDRLGIEVEWLVIDGDDPTRSVSAAETRAAAEGPLPDGGVVTVEPGGQLELSAVSHDSLVGALDALDHEESVLRDRCARAGLELLEIGLEPVREPPNTLDLPRYRAIESVFSATGPSPMLMATGSASVQVNVDVGAEPADAWRLAGLLGPVLCATFANSPFRRGAASGWKSTRQLLWSTVPGGRGAPVPTWSPDAWVERVLDSDVLYVQSGDDAEICPPGFTFRRWLAEGHDAGYPDADDLDVHLTTLFPPVRPRGWLELRMIDALPARARRVAVASAFTLLTTPALRDAVARACLPVAGRWAAAAEHGLGDPALATAARTCLDLAAEALADSDDGRPLAAECEAWIDSHVRHGRCPADDLLDEGDALLARLSRSGAPIRPNAD